MKAVLLLSGGQDSTTCLYWAKKRFEEIYPIAFYYRQSHSQELEAAKVICEMNDLDLKIFEIQDLLSGSSSSLTRGGDHTERSEVNPDLPAPFVAGRNLLFLTIAGTYASQIGSHDIITGVCATDYQGYPDCRRSTMDSIQLMLTIGMGIGDMRIHTPLMYMSKAEIWKSAKDLGIIDIITEHTITDYSGKRERNEWGYGSLDNPASELRMKGYMEAKERGWI